MERSIARRSLGLVQAYFAESLWKPRPSMRMTMKVEGRRLSGLSKVRVYSNLEGKGKMMSIGMTRRDIVIDAGCKDRDHEEMMLFLAYAG